VIGELMHGFRLGKNFKLHKAEMEDFLKEPQVEVVPITKRTGEIYGEILDHLQKMDIPVPTNDIWISAIAIEHYALLLTSDPHFTAIPNLKLNTPDN
jgi:tRNA(fMet)-specific endonuclease VapC